MSIFARPRHFFNREATKQHSRREAMTSDDPNPKPLHRLDAAHRHAAEPVTLNPNDASEPPSCIASALDAFLESVATYRELSERRDYLEQEVKRLDEELKSWEDVDNERRKALVGAVIELDETPLPSIDQWYYTVAPVWSARVGSKLVALTKGRDEDIPKSRSAEDICEVADITVIEIGGGR